MEKYIFDESNGLWYELQGDYYIPCLSLPEEEGRSIGLWGQSGTCSTSGSAARPSIPVCS